MASPEGPLSSDGPGDEAEHTATVVVPGAEPVTVLLFASARLAAGTAKTALPLVGQRVVDLRPLLVAAFPGVEGFDRLLSSCAIWVNGNAARTDAVVAPGDEVAVLPPISGGCTAVLSVVDGSLQPCRGL